VRNGGGAVRAFHRDIKVVRGGKPQFIGTSLNREIARADMRR
jgi:hypothetical protein